MGARSVRLRVGLAIGPTRLTAVEIRRTLRGRRPGRVWTWALEPAAGDGSWPALAEALAGLRAELGGGSARVTAGVALVRPFGHTKALAVPPVRRREIGALVLRNVRRYFAVGPEAALADARFLPRGRRPARADGAAAQRSALAVCAPQRDVEAVTAAIKAVGFRLDGITTASVALAEAIRALVPAARRGRVTAAVCAPDWLETIQLVGGSPRLVRPFPGTRHADPTAIARQILDTAAEAPDGARSDAERRGQLLTIGCGEVDGELRRAAAASEGGAPVLIAAPALRDLEPTALAAFGAATVGDDVPLVLPDDVRRERQARSRGAVARLWAAAAAAVVVAAGVHLWGLSRELRALEAERRAIAPAVARASVSRRAAVSVLSQLETVALLERTAPRYTEALTALADALPDSAYLVSFAARGTSFRVGGVAKATSAVVPALEASPLFAQVVLFSPVERDEASGSEQFDLTLALSGPVRSTSAGDVAPTGRALPRREATP
ncbi:MAG: PilN domain-containing protein [Gemmatimonadaceae bacterium]